LTNEAPIGVFDSGIGGLTVAHSILQHSPNERLIYFGDTAHLPYGDKAPSSIEEYSIKISDFLVERGCKAIVIACNTASSIAFEEVVKQHPDIPVFNVIDPVVDYVTSQESAKHIGVIGTKATINSKAYEERILERNNSLKVSSLATPLLVPLIEEHIMDESIGQQVIAKYLSQPILDEIDSIILGCTHYPLVKNSIEHFYQGEVKVVDSADVVGLHVKNELESRGIASNVSERQHEFYVSDFTESFEINTRHFFGQAIHLEEIDLFRSLKPGRI
jgi:glutamate racemase